MGRARGTLARIAVAALVSLARAPAFAADEARPYRPGDPRPWTPELRTECLEGNGDACRFGGIALEKGLGIAADPAAALDLYRRGCDLGDAAACQGFAWLAKGGHGVPADGKAAVRAYERACDLGLGDGCSGAGFLLAYGERDVIPNRVKAEKLLRRACDDRAHPRACAALAGLVEQRGDRAEALRIVEACCGADGGCCAQRDQLKAKLSREKATVPAATRKVAR
jgi:TPR repeat protein